jgi:phosphoribosylglycinamide formyltransferase 1
MVSNRKIAILISGRGSNMLALMDAVETGSLSAQIALVISNRADAAGVELARQRGYQVMVLPHRGLTRAEHENQLIAALQAESIELICLAGYMRLFSPVFLRAFPNRILNIHPSLLPAFPGVDAQQKAIDYGVKFSGCTVHFVDEECDSGPIILQAVVPVFDDDSAESLSARILVEEHKLYPRAVELVLNNQWQIIERRVVGKS